MNVFAYVLGVCVGIFICRRYKNFSWQAFACLIDRHPSILLALVIVAFGIVGSMDYADEKLQERIICERNPNPDFCRGVE